MSINPEAILSGAIDTALSTQLQPIPVGEYRAVIQDVGIRDFTYKKGERAGQIGYFLDVTWEILDENVQKYLGREKVTLRQNMTLDLAGDRLDTSEGKNVQLGRIRKAVGQNVPGQAWSPLNLKGQVAVIEIKHRLDGEDIFSEIKSVRPA